MSILNVIIPILQISNLYLFLPDILMPFQQTMLRLRLSFDKYKGDSHICYNILVVMHIWLSPLNKLLH
jgi:hypothetical protein